MARRDRIGKTATKIEQDGNWVHVRYHATRVLSYNPATRSVRLNSGGWHTNTTKARINQAANQFGIPISVSQSDYAWYVRLPDGTAADFRDNMEISY